MYANLSDEFELDETMAKTTLISRFQPAQASSSDEKPLLPCFRILEGWCS